VVETLPWTTPAGHTSFAIGMASTAEGFRRPVAALGLEHVVIAGSTRHRSG